jgi:hypothetical protein
MDTQDATLGCRREVNRDYHDLIKTIDCTTQVSTKKTPPLTRKASKQAKKLVWISGFHAGRFYQRIDTSLREFDTAHKPSNGTNTIVKVG